MESHQSKPAPSVSHQTSLEKAYFHYIIRPLVNLCPFKAKQNNKTMLKQVEAYAQNTPPPKKKKTRPRAERKPPRIGVLEGEVGRIPGALTQVDLQSDSHAACRLSPRRNFRAVLESTKLRYDIRASLRLTPRGETVPCITEVGTNPYPGSNSPEDTVDLCATSDRMATKNSTGLFVVSTTVQTQVTQVQGSQGVSCLAAGDFSVPKENHETLPFWGHAVPFFFPKGHKVGFGQVRFGSDLVLCPCVKKYSSRIKSGRPGLPVLVSWELRTRPYALGLQLQMAYLSILPFRL